MTPAAARGVAGLELARHVVARLVPDQILDPEGLADRCIADHRKLRLIQQPQRLSRGGATLTPIGREDRLGIHGVENLRRKH